MAVAKLTSFETWRGTAAEMATFASMLTGDRFIVTDGAGGLYVYTGAGWIVDPGGVIVLAAGTALVGKVGIDQTTPGTTNKVVAELTGSGITVGDPLFVSLATKLQAALDSIDVSKMSKGAVTTAHAAIADTATSAEISTAGFNAIKVYVGPFSAAENWTFKVQDCDVSGGTFIDAYEQANTGVMTLMSYQCNAARSFVFKGVGDHVKIVATRDGGASSVTVKVLPLNL